MAVVSPPILSLDHWFGLCWFEWHDTSNVLILKRDEPLLYSQFDGVDPSRTVKMIQAEKIPELMQYMEKISGVVEYENQRFLLFFGYINLNNIEFNYI